MNVQVLSKAELKKRIDDYVHEEPDARLQKEITDLWDRSSDQAVEKELRDRMEGSLRFGTAGIRAKMEGGYCRMNRVFVAKAAFAIGQFVLQKPESQVRCPRVLVGFDARKQSTDFACEMIEILTGMGLFVSFFEDCIPTPICAFMTRHKGADLGVMITASHNPANDNGIKLYGPKSAQLFGQALISIEDMIQTAPKRNMLNRMAMEEAVSKGRARSIRPEEINAYFEALKEARFIKPEEQDPTTKMVYTPLHGVGGTFAQRVLQEAGFPHVDVVEEQMLPDGGFPTLLSPNPEDPRCFTLPLKLAQRKNADVIFANDPDADRLAVMVKDEAGQFRFLSGNEIGALLGFFALKIPTGTLAKLAMSTVVSSRMLKHMAKAMGHMYCDALTGFSNIAERAIEREGNKDCQFVFAYEEAIGFLVGKVIWDKDGICTLVRFAECMAYLKAQGRTVLEQLDELYIRFGLFRTLQWSLSIPDVGGQKVKEEIMARFRDERKPLITHVDGSFMRNRMDLSVPQVAHDEHLPMADVLIWQAQDGTRLVIRPSGTEPKIKFYAEASQNPVTKDNLKSAMMELDAKLLRIQTEIKNTVL